MRVLAFLIGASILSAAHAAASGQFLDVTAEIEESDRGTRLAGLGQFNCVAEAVKMAASPACPIVATKAGPPPDPVEGIRILDSFYTTHVGAPTPGHVARNVGETVEDVDDAAAAGRSPTAPGTAYGGNNLKRDSGGLLPDLIAPGPGQLRAWYGHWLDRNGNGIVEAWRGTGAAAKVEDEWYSRLLGKIAAYVEPGSHPHVRDLERPGSSSPDFWYVPSAPSSYEYYEAGFDNGYFILFLDGSLLRSFAARSVTEPLLSPRDDGTAPYTTTATSLVDIDEYAAAAPGPLVGLYATLVEPIVTPFGSPSLGTCPNGCRPGPVSIRGTPAEGLEPHLAPFVQDVYARYPREHEPGEGSTSSGRHADHVEAYAGWIDLIPTWGYRNVSGSETSYYVRGGALPGKTADGRQAMLPGFLSFEVRTGLWKDLDGDGYIGHGGSDPYHNGFRPHADDYLDPRGEFFGAFADAGSYSKVVSFRITLVPDETWGDAGIVVLDDFTSSSGAGNPACLPPPVRVCAKDPTRHGAYRGDGPVLLNARRDVTHAAVGGDSVPGLYRSNAAFFPFGTSGISFTACTDVLILKYEAGGSPVQESLRDCDWIGPLAEASFRATPEPSGGSKGSS